jgi:transposase
MDHFVGIDVSLASCAICVLNQSGMVTSMLRGHAALRSELARLENRLRRIARADHVVRLMMTVPGVGAVVALQVKAGIDDPTRFRSSKNVGPHFGLTPRREQSGGPGTGVRVYLACGVTDMRKGIAGLAALTQDVLRQKPASGAVFAFRGRRGNRIKLLFWDGQGFCLYYKVLEWGRFVWPSAQDGSVRLCAALGRGIATGRCLSLCARLEGRARAWPSGRCARHPPSGWLQKVPARKPWRAR